MLRPLRRQELTMGTTDLRSVAQGCILLGLFTSLVYGAESTHAAPAPPTTASDVSAVDHGVDGGPARTPIQPQPTLGPEPRTLQLTAKGRTSTKVAANQEALASDLESLRQVVRRVEQVLTEQGEQRLKPTALLRDPAGLAGPAPGAAPQHSDRFGASLSARRGTAVGEEVAPLLVDAQVEEQSADLVTRELCALAGVTYDEAAPPSVRRMVVLVVKNLPWHDAMDRTLGQVGLAWRVEPGAQPRLRIIDATQGAGAGVRALERAATGTGAVAAEARWLLARRELDEGRPVEAMRRFNGLVEDFSRDKDEGVKPWILQSVRGLADCMMALRQWQEARGVFRNWLTRADDADPLRARVLLDSAEAGRRLGLERRDAVAFDEAMDDLHQLLERFGEVRNQPEVPLARLMIGGLLVDAQRWTEARTQLALYRDAAGGDVGDQVRSWIADCDYELNDVESALASYTALVRRNGHRDPRAPPAIYESAAYRVGLCHLKAKPARTVNALFAFQRARVMFPETRLDAELLVNIARCYAEIEREDEAVAALEGLLRKEGASSESGVAQDRMDQLVGSLLDHLTAYPGPVRSRVEFLIGQATHRRAERDRAQRAVLASQAVGWYERSLSEGPTRELRDAARLGLARAALLAGDAERGELELSNLLTDPELGDRDRAYAGRLLGDHLRAQGRPREAMGAYRGVLP
jgi:tetratricopeptide (TPR) repeat protein